MTKTEQYIKKAVAEASKKIAGNDISNCTFTMNLEADGATQILAEALLKQAEANKANSNAIKQLALSLKPIDVACLKIVQGE